jgi:hypothetical protein
LDTQHVRVPQTPHSAHRDAHFCPTHGALPQHRVAPVGTCVGQVSAVPPELLLELLELLEFEPPASTTFTGLAASCARSPASLVTATSPSEAETAPPSSTNWTSGSASHAASGRASIAIRHATRVASPA